MITREECVRRDAHDQLRPLRDLFALDRVDAEGLIYLDGNSLGVLPKATPDRVRAVVEEEWGSGLIRSWNAAGWITLWQRIAEKIARVIGVPGNGVVVADSTSLNLYKVLSAAIACVTENDARRRQIVSERTNFPTDLYIADTLARAHGFELALIDGGDVEAQLHDDVSIVLLTHVNYRTGRMHRMRDVTHTAHEAGALMVCDLSHSAGAVPIELLAAGAEADFAVGCGYKYLNGGPGAPAFAWVHPRHAEWMDHREWRQPLAGWLGHASPFDFTPDYRPAAGVSRFVAGTPPILSLAALECGVDTVLAADHYGGIAAIREKSLALSELFIDLVESRCAGHSLTLASPRAAADRGSQVAFATPRDGYAMMQALIARGVIGDFRAPDILRFGFTPLYTRFVDVWDAVDRLAQVLASGEWRESRFRIRAAVT